MARRRPAPLASTVVPGGPRGTTRTRRVTLPPDLSRPAVDDDQRDEAAREAEMVALLTHHYGEVHQLAGRWHHRYAWAHHVPCAPGLRPARIADFVAIDMWNTSAGPTDHAGPTFHGHEIKVSRGDWLSELRDPAKAAAFQPYLHYWWLVTPHADIVRDDLPPGWGLQVGRGTELRVVIPAPRRDPDPMPPALLAALIRSSQRAGLEHAATPCPCHSPAAPRP